MLPRIPGMAVSVEPEGGSPTGAPTGPGDPVGADREIDLNAGYSGDGRI